MTWRSNLRRKRLGLFKPSSRIKMLKYSLKRLREPVTRRCYVKKVFFVFRKICRKTCARVSFLIKLQAEACNFIKKETLASVLSCKFCEISKNTFFYGTLPVADSEYCFLVRMHTSFVITAE